ncbi:unnamed protein product [Closterium sp. Naga37s-1]|nr:unnamed protein product [Closterium sp. Naga37s-1]
MVNATMPLTLFSRMPYLRRLYVSAALFVCLHCTAASLSVPPPDVLASNIFLQGSITHLARPTSLCMLNLAWTSVTGSLPSAILSLPALSHLDIYMTTISGSLPSTLGRLTRLTYLNIGAENITGRVENMSWISSLTNLHTLVMYRMLSVEGDLSALTFLTALTAMQSLTIARAPWAGELPALLGTLTALTHLDVSGLRTTVFPRWSLDLTNLRFLDAAHYAKLRTGVMPQDLSRLVHLEHFDASGNGLGGALPDYWTSLKHLTYLSLGYNKFEGSIPSTFSGLTTLSTLILTFNSMDGTIPPVFYTTLNYLDVARNSFSGVIPPFIGTLSALSTLNLDHNNFMGNVPPSFTNLINLQEWAPYFNQLSSGLDVIGKMTWLVSLDISYNMFSSGLSSLLSLPTLSMLGLGANKFSGPFPSVLLTLTGLGYLDIGRNAFDGTIPHEISRLTNMISLTLGPNNFHGEAPLALYSLPLDELNLEYNNLSGSLPRRLSTGGLTLLNIQGNQLSGPLPDFAQWNTSIDRLLLGENRFTGSIGESISVLTSVSVISLRNNQLSGTIPSALLAALPNLEALDLSSNSISGSLPSTLGALSKLSVLLVHDNQLTGKLPSSICNLTQMHTMFLHNNSFYGEFPSCLYQHCLHRMGALLNIARNYFYGQPLLFADGCQFCPSEINQTRALDLVSLTNGGSGRCALNDFTTLVFERSAANKQGQASLRGNCFSVGELQSCAANETQRSAAECRGFCSLSNDLGTCDGHSACVPAVQTAGPGEVDLGEVGFVCECEEGYVAVNGSSGPTCTPPTPAPPSSLSTGALVGIAVGSAAALALLLALIVAVIWPRQRRRWSGLDVCREFSMADILRATDNWASANVVGKGGSATVYKGVAPTGELWAVKRISLMSNDFENEVRAMASLRHENVVRLLGFCLHQSVESGRQEQVLVYEYVPHGGLKHHIHHSNSPLTLQQRLKLAAGAAEGVAYLHSFMTPIIHRDLKPGNILVGEHNLAKIADFGLLKLLSHADGGDERTRVAGTPGYLDPDYNRTHVVSEKSDVYSFGVVLLELLTGRRAAVEGTDSHISEWAAQKVQQYELGELKDPMLDAPDEAIVDLADVALDCLKMPASRRPSMRDVARRLHGLLAQYCADDGPDDSQASPRVERERAFVGGENSTTGLFDTVPSPLLRLLSHPPAATAALSSLVFPLLSPPGPLFLPCVGASPPHLL